MLAISVREALRQALTAFNAPAQNLPSPLTPETLKASIPPLS
jgi:xanthine dehydrogenase molybdopterin-binding subunit B